MYVNVSAEELGEITYLHITKAQDLRHSTNFTHTADT